MKKLISLVLAGIMTFSLAACGQNATDNQTTAQNAQTTQSNEARLRAQAFRVVVGRQEELHRASRAYSRSATALATPIGSSSAYPL